MIRVFGITGTNGKTTAACMLRNILEQKGPCGLVGTIEYIIKDKTYIPENTTPGEKRLRQLFSEMDKEGVTDCVMEVSSHGLDQNRVGKVVFSGVGFTNLSHDHLDYHKDMESYYQTKKKLFRDDSISRCVTVDDSYGSRLYRELKAEGTGTGLKSCSIKMQDADFYGKIISSNIDGSVMDLYEGGVYICRLKVNMPGLHFASDALLAASMARQSGASAEDIAKGIGTLLTVKGRMEMTGMQDDTLGIVDYAHTPDGLERLLETVSGICRGKLFCVFGCGGFRDHEKRREMGEIAGRYSDYCIITNDNPRGEPPENIAQAIEEGLHPTGCGYTIILDRAQAIKRAVSLADKWDIIVVAGKGHEVCQISGGRAVPFDDKKVLKEFLEKKYERTYNETDRSSDMRPCDFRE